MIKPNHRPGLDGDEEEDCFSDAGTDAVLRLLRRWKKMCAERETRTAPSRAAEMMAMVCVDDDEELVNSCTRIA
jgi:hypothetical protein